MVIEPARVLLISHVADEQTIYGESLRAQGFDVRVADGPHQALAAAREATPDIIINRIARSGPISDRVQLLRELKQSDVTANVPVLVISSSIQPEVRAAATSAGCDGFLLLPVVPDTLSAEIRRVLQDR